MALVLLPLTQGFEEVEAALCFGLEIVKRLVGVASYQAVKEGMLLEFCE